MLPSLEIVKDADNMATGVLCYRVWQRLGSLSRDLRPLGIAERIADEVLDRDGLTGWVLRIAPGGTGRAGD